MEFKEQIHMEDNGIYYLMQWSQFLSIRRAQLIMISTSKLVAYCPILQSPLVLRKVTVMIHGTFLQVTVQMGVLRLKGFILVNHTVQCHMLTHSE